MKMKSCKYTLKILKQLRKNNKKKAKKAHRKGEWESEVYHVGRADAYDVMRAAYKKSC